MSEIDKLAERYPFRVPPYFALILRCFSVIEGIALRVDPQVRAAGEAQGAGGPGLVHGFVGHRW